MAVGLLNQGPWRVNEHCVLEAQVPDGPPVLFCSSCWHHAVCQNRGLKGDCKGLRKISGGSAYTFRLRLQRGERPSQPGVSFSKVVSPSAATRASWSQALGVALGASAVEFSRHKVCPFTEQPSPRRLELATVLLAFGLDSMEEAGTLGRRELEARAAAASRKARGDPDLDGE